MVSKKREPLRRPDTARQPEQSETAPESALEQDSADRVQRILDEALADSFPASDPVSIVTSQHEEAWERQRPQKGPRKL